MKILSLVFVLLRVSEAHNIKVVDMSLIDLNSGTLLRPERVWGEIQKPDNIWTSDANLTLNTMPKDWLFLLETPLQHIPISNGSVDVEMVKEAYEMVNGKKQWYDWQNLWIEHTIRCLYNCLSKSHNSNATYLGQVFAYGLNVSLDEAEHIYIEQTNALLGMNNRQVGAENETVQSVIIDYNEQVLADNQTAQNVTVNYSMQNDIPTPKNDSVVFDIIHEISEETDTDHEITTTALDLVNESVSNKSIGYY